MIVSATMFDTEPADPTLAYASYLNAKQGDYLEIHGVRYQGTVGPANVSLAAGDFIRWNADPDTSGWRTRVHRRGFVICATPAPALPTPALSPEAPSSPPSPPLSAWFTILDSSVSLLGEDYFCCSSTSAHPPRLERGTLGA